MMPGMNGMELARRLMPSHPAMKVLLISGYTEEEIGKFVRGKAGTAFLQKPVTPSVLSRKVREVLTPRFTAGRIRGKQYACARRAGGGRRGGGSRTGS